jgi:hypothetical protein
MTLVFKFQLQPRTNGFKFQLQPRTNGFKFQLQPRTNGFKFKLQTRTNGFKIIVYLNAFVTYSTPKQATYEDEQVRRVHQGLQ